MVINASNKEVNEKVSSEQLQPEQLNNSGVNEFVSNEDINMKEVLSSDITESNLDSIERSFLKEKNVDYLKTDELTRELSDKVIAFVENKISSLLPVNTSWDELEKLQQEWYAQKKEDIVVIRDTSKGRKYLLNVEMYNDNPERSIADRYIIDVYNDYVISEDKNIDREIASRTFDVVKNKTKFVVDGKIYEIV